MNKSDAIAHLAQRKSLLDDRYVDRYPKWTVADYVALCVVLDELHLVKERACPTPT